METQDWLVNIVIVLAVILVIGTIVYFFFPETWQKVATIADEVFGVSAESKAAENTTISINSIIGSIASCMETNSVDCYCNLNRGSIPEGYKILLKNEENGLLITGFGKGEEIIAQPKLVQGLKISLAMVGKYNVGKEEYSDLLCNKQDLIIKNEGGKIVVYPPNSKQAFEFFTDKGFDVPELLRFENEICFMTDAIEEELPLFNPAAATFITKEQKLDKENILKLISNIISFNLCAENAPKFSSSLSWPIMPDYIQGITSCYNAYKDSFGIEISAKESSKIIVPFKYASVVDYCIENCKDGASITLYELLNEISYLPTGRYAIIKNIDSITQTAKEAKTSSKTEQKAETQKRVINWRNARVLPFGTEIATGTNVEFVLGIDRDIALQLNQLIEPELTVEGFPEFSKQQAVAMLCSLPRLRKEVYKSQSCEEIKLSTCTNYAELFDSPRTIHELGFAISALNDKSKGSMDIVMDSNYVLLGFEKDKTENECTTPDTDKPKQCGNNPCICLCMKRGLLSSPDCEKYGYCYVMHSGLGFEPLFINGGKECSHGTYLKPKETYKTKGEALVFELAEISKTFTKIYYERKGKTLGLCAKPPCIVENY